MRIDWHVHINDPRYIGPPYWPSVVPMSVHDALAAHELAELDRTVISNAVHYIRHMSDPKDVLAAIASSNRHLAKCRDDYPDKFVCMATCVPNAGDEMLRELERAVKQDDARAVIINSSHRGRRRVTGMNEDRNIEVRCEAEKGPRVVCVGIVSVMA